MTTSIPHKAAPEGTSDEYTPKKEDKFTFVLWTVDNRGRDPFGDFVCPEMPPVRSVQKLSAFGVVYDKIDNQEGEVLCIHTIALLRRT